MSKVFICAEAGVNHLGDRAKMLALCDAAKAAGASAVKFQAYDAEALCLRRGLAIRSDAEAHSTCMLLEKCELSDADLDAIAAHCKSIGLKWFASVFDPLQIERVLSRGACALKIGHAEADYDELVAACSERAYDDHRGRLPLYVSYPPSFDPSKTYSPIEPVLCVCEYPATSEPHLARVSDGWTGDFRDFAAFSSHYTDYRIPAAAALRGAEYIEAHLMLGGRIYAWNGSGERIGPYTTDEPEREWSLSPDEFGAMVRLIREYEGWL